MSLFNGVYPSQRTLDKLPKRRYYFDYAAVNDELEKIPYLLSPNITLNSASYDVGIFQAIKTGYNRLQMHLALGFVGETECVVVYPCKVKKLWRMA